MASGQIFSLTVNPPGQKYAVEETFAATTTATGSPYEVIPVWAFDGATQAAMDFYTKFAGLSATGALILRFDFMCTSTATLGVRFRAAIRLYTDGESAIGAHTFSFQSVDDVTNGVAHEVNTTAISFTATQIDGVSNNAPAMLRLYRDATATWDGLTTNAYVLQGGVVLAET